MSQTQILYIEPKRIADWEDGMGSNFCKGLQNFTPKFHFIRLIASIHKASKESSLDDTAKRIIREYVKDDRCGLGDEIRSLFPELF
jgi:hypothetical protein